MSNRRHNLTRFQNTHIKTKYVKSKYNCLLNLPFPKKIVIKKLFHESIVYVSLCSYQITKFCCFMIGQIFSCTPINGLPYRIVITERRGGTYLPAGGGGSMYECLPRIGVGSPYDPLPPTHGLPPTNGLRRRGTYDHV